MFTTFSSVPLSPPPADTLREVQCILEARGLTFGILVADALQDTTTSLGVTVISELANIFEALRPHFNEDEKARALLGRFFASIASPELLRVESGVGGTSWKLPAMNLSTDQLMGFSLEEMGAKITSGAPALSSFLDSICGGPKPGGRGTDNDEKGGSDVEDEVGDDSEFGTEARRKVSPAQLLEIVSFLACYIFIPHAANRGRSLSQALSYTRATRSATYFRPRLVYSFIRHTRQIASLTFSIALGSVFLQPAYRTQSNPCRQRRSNYLPRLAGPFFSNMPTTTLIYKQSP